jgi:arsenical pump membrane protein
LRILDHGGTGIVRFAVALTLLLVTLAVAIRRPRQLPEAVVAVPAATMCVLVGASSWRAARHQVHALAPTLAFLAAVLVLAKLCAQEGLFDWAGSVLARTARGSGPRLLAAVLLLGAAITTVLSLDATVVLFTPVVAAAALRAGLSARPHLHATAHVANSASLLLPVSNLTNLLVFHAAGLSVARFAALMLLPSLVVLAVEYSGARACFAAELGQTAMGQTSLPENAPLPRPNEATRHDVPKRALVVLAATLVGFVVCSPLGIAPAWAAAAGALALGTPRLWAGRTTPREVLAAADPLFLIFVAALAVIVDAVSTHGLNRVVRPLVSHHGGLLGLLTVAAVGALVANLVNNLPATLLLLPATLPGGPIAVLALLIGVNVGPNLTYVGSLATMLWLRVCRGAGITPRLATFTRHALVTVVPALIGATTALWLASKVVASG